MILTAKPCLISFIIFLAGCGSQPPVARKEAQPAPPPLVLPAGFEGESCAELLTEVKKLIPTQTQFEKTPDFDARVSATLANAKVGEISLNQPLWFVAANFRPDIDASYRADEEILSARMKTDRRSVRLMDKMLDLRQLTLASTSEHSTYKGANRFGASTQVVKIKQKTCAVTLVNSERWPLLDGLDVQRVSVEHAKQSALQNALKPHGH